MDSALSRISSSDEPILKTGTRWISANGRRKTRTLFPLVSTSLNTVHEADEGIRGSRGDSSEVSECFLWVVDELLLVCIRDLDESFAVVGNELHDSARKNRLLLDVVNERVVSSIFLQESLPSERFPDGHAHNTRLRVRAELSILARSESVRLLHLADTDDEPAVSVRLLVNESRSDTRFDCVVTDVSVVLRVCHLVRVHLVNNPAQDVVTFERCFLRVTRNDPELLGELQERVDLRVSRILLEPRRVLDASLQIAKEDFLCLLLARAHHHECDTRTRKKLVERLWILEAQSAVQHVR